MKQKIPGAARLDFNADGLSSAPSDKRLLILHFRN